MAVTLHLTLYNGQAFVQKKIKCFLFRISGSNFFQFFKAHVRGVAIESCTRLEGVAPIWKRQKNSIQRLLSFLATWGRPLSHMEQPDTSGQMSHLTSGWLELTTLYQRSLSSRHPCPLPVSGQRWRKPRHTGPALSFLILRCSLWHALY